MYGDIRKEAMALNISSFDALTATACSIGIENNVDIFLCITETGKIARSISKFRPY